MLMISLALVNDGAANDDHIEVAEMIFNEGKIPEPQRCWQCYHPKLYHYSVAQLSHFLDLETRAKRTVLAQSINAIAGIFTLLICWTFIKKQLFREEIKLLCLATIAFNPRFIAIHAQASNDAFLILFGTILIFALYKLMEEFNIKCFFIVLTVAILAGVTKGNSFILIAGVIVGFLLKMIVSQKMKWRTYLGSLLFFIMLTTILIGYLGEYFSNYKKYGKPVVYNTPITTIPNLFEKTTFRRPGVQSIVGAYFTFRWVDLIQNPMISNDADGYPLHRTSLWSQLYGRSNFIYFDNWPPGKWQSKDSLMMNIGRISLVLAIIPTFLFLIGLFKELKKWTTLFFNREWDRINANQEWIFQIFIFGFLVFIILFTATGRDYSFMKVIYLYPWVLAILIPLLKGFEWMFSRLRKNGLQVFYFLITLLYFSYIIPVMDLILNLMNG